MFTISGEINDHFLFTLYPAEPNMVRDVHMEQTWQDCILTLFYNFC